MIQGPMMMMVGRCSSSRVCERGGRPTGKPQGGAARPPHPAKHRWILTFYGTHAHRAAGPVGVSWLCQRSSQPARFDLGVRTAGEASRPTPATMSSSNSHSSSSSSTRRRRQQYGLAAAAATVAAPCCLLGLGLLLQPTAGFVASAPAATRALALGRLGGNGCGSGSRLGQLTLPALVSPLPPPPGAAAVAARGLGLGLTTTGGAAVAGMWVGGWSARW